MTSTNTKSAQQTKQVLEPQPERLKSVVRRLPANLPEPIFWQSVQQWVSDDTASWRQYWPGKIRKKPNKEQIPSRAYIAFKTEEQLFAFANAFDGHVFRDKAGHETVCVVEFAPNQRIPSEKYRVDRRVNTINEDEDYVSFLKSLEAAATKPSDALNIETLLAAAQPLPEPESTPLLDALKADKERAAAAARDREILAKSKQKEAKKDKEKDTSAPLSGNVKVSDKQPSTPNSKKPNEPSTGSGKKGKKGGPSSTQPKPPSASKSSANAPSSSTPAPTPSKPSKAARKKQALATSASQKPESAPKPPIPSEASFPSLAAAAATNTSSNAPPAPRTARPMLGLQSRQFEAALSGVAGGRGGASRRGGRGRATDGSAPTGGSAATQ